MLARNDWQIVVTAEHVVLVVGARAKEEVLEEHVVADFVGPASAFGLIDATAARTLDNQHNVAVGRFVASRFLCLIDECESVEQGLVVNKE